MHPRSVRPSGSRARGSSSARGHRCTAPSRRQQLQGRPKWGGGLLMAGSCSGCVCVAPHGDPLLRIRGRDEFGLEVGACRVQASHRSGCVQRGEGLHAHKRDELGLEFGACRRSRAAVLEAKRARSPLPQPQSTAAAPSPATQHAGACLACRHHTQCRPRCHSVRLPCSAHSSHTPRSPPPHTHTWHAPHHGIRLLPVGVGVHARNPIWLVHGQEASGGDRARGCAWCEQGRAPVNEHQQRS